MLTTGFKAGTRGAARAPQGTFHVSLTPPAVGNVARRSPCPACQAGAITYNQDQGYLRLEIEMIQRMVGAAQDGIWGYDTIQKVKGWQARHGLVADGRVGPETLSRMGIHRAGDYPMPTETYA